MSTVPSSIPKKNPAPAPAQPTPAATSKAEAPQKRGGSGFLIILVIAVLVFGALLYFFGVAPRMAASADLTKEQKTSSQRIVIYAEARLAAPKVELPLPGTLQAFQQASIFARTSGYVKRWMVDIGDQVHEGDLLAELDTPEVDQQLSQAKATAVEAKAAVDIAQTAADRWNAMVVAHAVSQEEADEKNATLKEAQATLNADEANVGQLTAQENFKHIVAPFTGTITFRNIEVGNLVTAPIGSNNSSTTGTTEMYRIAQTDPLRLYVSVPEANSRAIQPGVSADLHVSSYPDRVFHGEIVRSAGAIDTASRTLNTEIRVANPDGALLPGTFAEVVLELTDGTPSILIPANTLVVNSAGTQVAFIENIDGQDKIHYLPVKVGRDFGTQVEILQDLKDGDRLVTNPAADLSEGTVVTAKPLPKPAIPAPASPAPKPQP
jgi:membrane fusion protein, multidrug efflux system